MTPPPKTLRRRSSDKGMGPVVRGFLIASVAWGLAFVYQTNHITSEVRTGCARLDLVRAVEYDVLSDAAADLEKRAEALRAELPETRQTIRTLKESAESYRGHVQDLVDTVHPYEDEERGEAHVDCTEAYPNPLPLVD